MKALTIDHYLKAVRAHWLATLVLTVVGGALAAGYAWTETPQYEASIQLFVSASGSSSNIDQLNQGGAFSQERVKSYSDILDSPAVTALVISELNLSISPDELSKEISASSPLDTVLLNVTVTDASPTRARDIANALAKEFPKLVNEIETPAGSSTSPVKVSITRRATVPDGPVSPRYSLITLSGLVLGAIVGVAIAVTRVAIDRTIGNSQEAAEIAGAPVLGTIPESGDISGRGLVAKDLGTAPAEAYRRLRTNIRFLSVDRQLRSFVVTGSLPGEGKTTTAANLAIALAESGEPVALVDGDLRRPALADLFALSNGVGLTNVLLGDVNTGAALQRWREDLPLFVLTAGPRPPNPSELLGSGRLAGLVDHLSSSMTVIFDSPPLLPVTDAAILARATGGALVVTRIDSTTTDQLANSINSLQNVDAVVLGLVANRVAVAKRSGKNKNAYFSYYTQAEERVARTR